jgi:hypothetical protein
MAISIVDFPIKPGDFPYVSHNQRVSSSAGSMKTAYEQACELWRNGESLNMGKSLRSMEIYSWENHL